MKILVINPFGIGDVIFSFPLIETLKSAGYQVDILCNARTVDLAQSNPSIHKYFVFERDQIRKKGLMGWVKVFRMLKKIKNEKYACAVDLSMGREYSLWMMLCGVKKRIGFNYRNRGRFLTKKLFIGGFEDKSVREYMLDLAPLVHSSIHIENHYPQMKLGDIADKNVDDKKQLIVVAPGGGVTWGQNAEFKQWGESNYSELIKKMSTNKNVKFIIIGSMSERDLCERVAHRSQVVNLEVVTEAKLLESMKILKRTKLFIGNDGGLLHLANLLEAPTIGLYGPVSEVVYGTLDENVMAETLTQDVSCRPCYHNFRFPECEHDKQCLKKLTVDKVYNTALKILSTVGN